MPDEEVDIESQPFTDGTGTSTNYAAPSPGSKMPPLNLARAQHILNKFTEDPSWLANPRTAHAANAVFSAASKIVGMGIQMERVENMGVAVKNRNEFTKQKVDALGKISGFVPDGDDVGQAELGRLNGMASLINTPDFNLSEFANGVSRLQAKYTPRQTDVITLSDGTRGYRDDKGNFHQNQVQLKDVAHANTLENIDARFQNQLALIDPKNEAAKDRLRERYKLAKELFTEELPQKTAAQKELVGARTDASEHLIGVRKAADIELTGTREQNAEKLAKFKSGLTGGKTDRPVTVTERDPITGSTIARRMTLADAEQLPAMVDSETGNWMSQYASEKANLESGDKSVGPDWMHLSNRAKNLAELKTKIEQKGVNPDTGRRLKAAAVLQTPATTNAPAAVPMPQTKSDLKSGQRYSTPRGEATWDGEKFVQ